MHGQPMTPDEAKLRGDLTALNFAVENLWACVLGWSGASAEDVRRMRDEMLRQAELPSRNAPEPGDDLFAVQQYSIARLETLWDQVEKRLSQGWTHP